MVEIIGKRGKKVPVILTAEMTRSIDLLIKTREAVAIPEKNPFVFARPNRQSLQCMRAWDCLRNISMQCQPPLLNPANITSTKLRKYIATISQVLSMEEKEVDWLARHLGHDIRVHRDFYRLHESTIEIAKVSKLLLTVDQGETRKFAGKTLQEINLNGKKNTMLQSYCKTARCSQGLFKDVRANCFCASLLRTQMHTPRHTRARALSNKMKTDRAKGHCYSFAWI